MLNYYQRIVDRIKYDLYLEKSMDSLEGLKTVIAVVETHSFTAASERLGMSKALVSKYVGEVEKQLNIRLFNRTTRQISLTEAGKNYYQHAITLLEQYATMVDSVTGEQSSPRGLLRISAPVTFGEMKLAPLMPKLLQQFPDLEIELQLTNSAVDMLEDAIDVRIRIGGVDDSTMIARHLQTIPLVLSASKNYLTVKGRPVTPEQLADHNCIIDSNFRIGKHWPLIAKDNKSHTITVKSKMAVNSPQAVREMAIAGGGIAMTPKFIVDDAIENGQLQQILPEYTTLEFGLFAIYPHRKYIAKKVRCFIDFLLEEFSRKNN